MEKQLRLIAKDGTEFRGVFTKYAYKVGMIQDRIIRLYEGKLFKGFIKQSELILKYRSITTIKPDESLNESTHDIPLKSLKDVDLFTPPEKLNIKITHSSMIDFMKQCESDIVESNNSVI